MSYREIVFLCEMLEELGFEREVSVDDFKKPNVGLVADILKYLVELSDPTLSIRREVDTEEDRVFFFRSVVEMMAGRCHILLNGKRLYESTNLAARELLKIAQPLYEGHELTRPYVQFHGATPVSTDTLRLNHHSETISADEALRSVQRCTGTFKATRAVASELTRLFTRLYDLLESENEYRQVRHQTISRTLPMEQIEARLGSEIKEKKSEVQTLRQTVEKLSQDYSKLHSKLERKEKDLKRSEKRLESLEVVRPSFMDEYEKLEDTLSRLHETYVTLYRNVQFLEHQFSTELSKGESSHGFKSELERIQAKLPKAEPSESFPSFDNTQVIDSADLDFAVPIDRRQSLGGARAAVMISDSSSDEDSTDMDEFDDDDDDIREAPAGHEEYEDNFSDFGTDEDFSDLSDEDLSGSDLDLTSDGEDF